MNVDFKVEKPKDLKFVTLKDGSEYPEESLINKIATYIFVVAADETEDSLFEFTVKEIADYFDVKVSVVKVLIDRVIDVINSDFLGVKLIKFYPEDGIIKVKLYSSYTMHYLDNEDPDTEFDLEDPDDLD